MMMMMLNVFTVA